MYIEIISIIATILGAIMSISWFIQAHKIWKNKSSKDVSIIFLSIFSLGNLVWLIYGLALKQLPVIISFAIGLVGCVAVLVLALKYRKGKKKSGKRKK
ncbi:MAG: SemiSWEET family sugar transporter [Candidatus Nanoarchaeia archaeon]